jgi:GNAT superfamily N-acetyltransferase
MSDTPSSIAIRQLTPADAADYRTIRLAALQGAPEAFGSTYAAEAGLPLQAFADRLATSVVLGAYDGARVVGTVGFKAQTGAKDAHKGFVWGFYVAPQARGRGVGRALMDGIVAAATGRGTAHCRWCAPMRRRWPCMRNAASPRTAWSRARSSLRRAMPTKS